MPQEITGHLQETLPVDFWNDMQPAEVAATTLERLVMLANQATDLSSQVDKATIALAELQEAHKRITRVQIPELMAELGVKDFKMEDGRTIVIGDKVNASISEANRPEAFSWLSEHNYDGIIKTNVQAAFGKGEMEDALKAKEALVVAGFSAVVNQSIHPATLLSFVKERLEKGDTLPPSFSIFEFKEAKVTTPKAKKSRN